MVVWLVHACIATGTSSTSTHDDRAENRKRHGTRYRVHERKRPAAMMADKQNTVDMRKYDDRGLCS